MLLCANPGFVAKAEITSRIRLPTAARSRLLYVTVNSIPRFIRD